MRICFSTSRADFRFLLICLIFILSARETASANRLTEQSALESENKARQLSKEWGGDAIRRSVILFLETSEAWERLGAKKKASFCLRESARLSLLVSDYETAFTSLNKALRIDDKANDIESKILTLSLLSRAATQKGDVKKSENYYKQALDLSRLSPGDETQANALFSAAEYNYLYGNVTETIKLYERALSFAEKTGDKALIAQSLLNIGYCHAREGNPVYGLQKVKEALAEWREINDARGEALSNFGIGWIYTLMDEKQSALDFYRKAEAMFPEDVDWLEKAKLLNGIATIYERYEEFNLGEKYRRRALELYEKAGYPHGRLATLITLAKLSYRKGDKITGEKLYDDAYLLAKRMNDNFYLAVIKENLGNLHLTDGEYDKAINNYQEALSVYKNLGVALPRVENGLGRAFEKKGNYPLARKFYGSALMTNRKIRDIIPAAENLYNLARLSKAEGQTDAALAEIKESLVITDSVYYDVTNNNLRRNYLANVFERYEFYINLLMNKYENERNADLLKEALQAAEKSRARSMLETLSLADAGFVKDADPETVKREKEIRSQLNQKSDKLVDLLTRNTDQAEVNKLDGEIRELENELEEIKGRLKQSSPIYSAIKNPPPFDVAEFQSKIRDENSLLLEFSLGKEESYLWVVGKNEINSYVLPPRGRIEPLVQNLRELLVAREIKPEESVESYQARISDAEKSYWQQAQILSNELFGQISDKLNGKRLIIVPDGKLHYFPVSALPTPNSADAEPILLANEVIYEPSASMFLLLSKNEIKSSAATKNLLIFSDPVFSTEDSRLATNNKTGENSDAQAAPLESFRFAESLNLLPRLTASRDEADSVINVVGSSESEAFSGFSANRERLLSTNVSDFKIIHFATHSLVNEERPELSGIVLSRFDEGGKKLDEFVRLQDIYSMNLKSDLVVLSACNTGNGKEVKGEGLMSLNNAFLQVGAKSVLSTLWKVDDNATKELMKDFYRGLTSENLTTAQALRQAQINLARNPQYKSPFYWAAFIIQGDFQNTPELSGGVNYKVYFLLIIPLLIFGVYLFRKVRLFHGETVSHG